jgi:MFS transporter, AAHS family, 4-hydroxybenzoate transporter
MAAVAENTRFAANEMKLSGTPVAHLFKEGRTLTTLMFWIVFFTSLLDLYLLSNWLPSVLNDLGVSISVAAIVGAMLQIGGLAGTFVLGTFVDKFSFRALFIFWEQSP